MYDVDLDILDKIVAKALGCGTTYGYATHLQNKEYPCDLCFLSKTTHTRSTRCINCLQGRPDLCPQVLNRRKKKKLSVPVAPKPEVKILKKLETPVRKQAEHGTISGYNSHKYYEEPACRSCILAKNSYSRHRANNEDRCQPCLDARPEECERPPTKTNKKVKVKKDADNNCYPATIRTYRKHLRNKEKSCDKCRMARRNYNRHKKQKVPICQHCKEGNPELCRMPSGHRKAKHGTISGYDKHKVNGEVPCDPCRLAGNAYARHSARKESRCQACLDARPQDCERPARSFRNKTKPKDCDKATLGRYQRHLKFKEPSCDRCRLASRNYNRHRRQKIPLCQHCRDGNPELCKLEDGRTHKPITHGIRRGYDNHKFRGEDPCDPCRMARNSAGRHAVRNEPLCKACLDRRPQDCEIPGRGFYYKNQ